MSLAFYLMKVVGGRILGALAVLVGILQILDLLDVTGDIIDRNLGAAGVFYYAALRLPRLIEQAAPVAALAGALFGFGKLAQESAITAMRSTGISAYRITALALPAAAVLGAVTLLIGQVVAPRADARLTEWWQATAPKEADAKPVDAVTFRFGSDIVTAKLAEADGRRMTGVVIYRRDDHGRLVQRTTAEEAVFDGRGWRLAAPKFESLDPASVSTGEARQMTWAPNLRPADLQMLIANQPTVSPTEAQRALQGGVSVRPRTYYDTQVQRAWAGPIACIVMLLLAAPSALANFRGGGATLVVECLAAGLLFLVVDGAFTALGESGAAPALLAAWAAPAMFAALGMSTLLYREG